MPSKKLAKPNVVTGRHAERIDPATPSDRRTGRSGMSEVSLRPFVKIVEWSPEDACFVGSAPPLVGRCCHGDREEEVFAELSQIVEEWLAIHAADSKALPATLSTKRSSGKFQLRLTPDLHRLLALRAAMSRRSINDLAVEAIRKAVAPGGG
jgi:predicted HicB family RNase H-like nuclease